MYFQANEDVLFFLLFFSPWSALNLFSVPYMGYIFIQDFEKISKSAKIKLKAIQLAIHYCVLSVIQINRFITFKSQMGVYSLSVIIVQLRLLNLRLEFLVTNERPVITLKQIETFQLLVILYYTIDMVSKIL